MKLFILEKVFIVFFILFVIGCGSKPEPKPEPKPDGVPVRQKIETIDQEISALKTKQDISGVKLETTGMVEEILDEPDAVAQQKYQTGKPGWIRVEGERGFDGSTSPDEARQKLLQILRNKAVMKKVGTKVDVISLITDITAEENDEIFEQFIWSGFFKSTVSGMITDEKYEDSMMPNKDGYSMKMTLDAFVEPVTGQRDPGFFIDAHLKTNMLKEGQELIVNIKPSKNAYLYILNLMADNNAMLMYPNNYMKENFIEANREITIPSKEMEKISIKVGVMPGQTITSESIYIVCTKEKVPMIDKLPKIGTSLKTFSGKSKNFIELQRWLTNIPLNQRTEKALIYHVSK